MTTLADLEQEIEQYILDEQSHLDQYAEDKDGDEVIWIVKYIPSQYLNDFLAYPQIRISNTPGFTWGDAVYVAPLMYPYSSMMYGRAGIIGYIRRSALSRSYRADQSQGVDFYTRWITYQHHLYTMLTTTIHADHANRELRNRFRQRFNIDLVMAQPDQGANRYTDLHSDRWFAVSDWKNLTPSFTSLRRGFTDLIEDCKWLVIVGEDFKANTPATTFQDLFGNAGHMTVLRDGPGSASSSSLYTFLVSQHSGYSAGVPTITLIRTDP